MNNAIYSHTVAFLEVVGSWNIHDVISARITMINRLFSRLSSVSQPDPSQEVQIRQITISISWQRQETWLATIAVQVCTQGLYAVCPRC